MAGDKDKEKEEPLSAEEVKAIKNINIKNALRQRLFSQIQQLYDMSKNLDSDPAKLEIFMLRASEIDKLRNRYEEVSLEIYQLELVCDPMKQFQGNEIDSFDDLYYLVKLAKSRYVTKIADPQPSATDCLGTGLYGQPSECRPRLPKLELFTFDGNIENFTTFYETFCSLVHNQTGISKIDKFHYLLSCTKGAALNIVKSLPISTSNYDIVWQGLLDKYQDERTLVGKYLDKMLNFVPLSKESVTNLEGFIEVYEHSYRAIKALKVKNLSSYLLCHIALRALDQNTKKSFEQNLDQSSIPTYDQLMSHVHNQIKVLSRTASGPSTGVSTLSHRSKPSASNVNKPTTTDNVRKCYSQTSESKKKMKCIHCGDNHMIFRCSQFRKLTPTQRVSRADTLNLCHNCLKSDHASANCKSDFKCFTCNQDHHALLHVDSDRVMSQAAVAVSTPPPPPVLSTDNSPYVSKNDVNSCHASSLSSKSHSVVLGTAVVHVIDAFGCEKPCRVLIDSGAQSNFITISCLERLGLPRKKCPLNIFGLGGENVKNHGMTSCTVKPRHCVDPRLTIDAVVLPKITSDLPTIEIPEKVINHYKNLTLADPYFYRKGPIDIILAADVFPEIYDGNKVIVNSSIPAALSSIFGYVVTGKFEVPCTSNCVSSNMNTSLVSYTTDNDLIENYLQKFWEVESSPCETPLDPMDKLAEDIYTSRIYRDDNGRYISPLLLNPNREPLGDSYSLAMKRLLQVERRLLRSPDLQAAYVDFMREYEQLGHMEPYTGSAPTQYFIPHHCVIRSSSTTTPLRVVFDGSAKTSNGVSLNDSLLTGRKLHHDILKILFQFRMYPVCFTADIAKAYRQVLIDPSERSYQHILWRESCTDPVKVYELKTNTYGLRSAPYIAVRTLQQLASDARAPGVRSQACDILMNGFFVDDLLWSTQTFEEACTLQDELIYLLKLGGFDLRKWASNSQELLQRVDAGQTVSIEFKDDSLSPLKVLGLKWVPKDDCFSYNYNLKDNTLTKRSVLKLLASIFDPNGFLSPCTFLAKCIMQDLWKLSLDWDEPLPSDLREKWERFIFDLPLLSNMRIERHILIPHFKNVQLIAFCDASTKGYAACIYLRSVNKNNEVKTRLLVSKSKVAPLSPPHSVPRLELMAAVLLSKLVLFVKQNIRDFEYPIFAFSDSSVVLAWLQTPPYKLKTFVSNRVAKIIEVIPPNRWYHVSSENNAADLCSRGAMPKQLIDESSQWLHGPSWLDNDVRLWPIKSFYVKNDSDVLELKSNNSTFSLPSQATQNVSCGDLEETFERFSDFRKLQRVMAWCKRFISNVRKPKGQRMYGPLNTTELRASHDLIVSTVQQKHFSLELNQLKDKKTFIPSLRKLSPFLDENCFLRVGGRISQSDLPYGTKHPILLPKKSHVTKLLIEYYHQTYLHVGPRTLQGILCKKYWIVCARSIIRSVLSKCIKCFKCNPSSKQPCMGELPAPRVKKTGKAFDHVGCDIGGPFYIKEHNRRNAKIQKAYLCLFVCFSTKAVHLEVLSDLSTDCFLASLDRLVARRGLCSCLYSDCGTNFIAAGKHLKEVCSFFLNQSNNNCLADGCAARLITWKHNAPSAPNMGGLWEAGIKSAKHHLYRAVGDKALTFEELSTLFCKVEAIMNSRPLCALSDNPNEFEVLTAGHFLIGQSLLTVPEYNLEDIPLNRLSRWQLVQKASQSFWKRWYNDYLLTLQQRAKWQSSPPNLKVGDLVLVKSEQSRPLQWPMGRIKQVHPGPDNIVRVVTLRTQKGTFKRPVNKICPLPHVN